MGATCLIIGFDIYVYRAGPGAPYGHPPHGAPPPAQGPPPGARQPYGRPPQVCNIAFVLYRGET